MADSSPWWRRRPGLPADEPPPTPAPPAGPRGERTKTVAMRLTPEEYEAWAAAAAADGRGQMGRWVRETVTDHLAGRTGPKQIEGLRELRSDLSHAGSNLNQIARSLNVAKRLGVPAPEVKVVTATINAMRVELAAVRDRLQSLG